MHTEQSDVSPQLTHSRVVRRILVISLLSAVIGLLGDWGHVESGTTTYNWAKTPTIGHSAWWFLILLFILVSAVCLLHPFITRKLAKADQTCSLKQAITTNSGLLCIYLASALLKNSGLGLTTMLLLSGAVLIWSLADASLLSLSVGLAVAVIGVGSEILLVAAGTFSYDDKVNSLFGVAPWLPAIYFLAGVSISTVDRLLTRCKNFS